MQPWLSTTATPADKMLQPGANVISPYMQNPKSILADRSQNPNNNNPLQRMNYFNNPRVTFAQGALNRRKADGGSSTSVSMTPPGSAKDGHAGSPGQKLMQPGQVNKYNFGVFQTNKNALSANKPDASSTISGGEGQNKGGPTLGRKSTKNISVLYPANKVKPNKYKSTLSLGPSVGTLLPRSKSTEASVTTAKSTSRTNKSTRSLTSNAPKRAKSGKKLKKRRKSKSAQLDTDMDSFKPAKLDEEYASELNKITKILKAVSAFDEATATENGSVNFGSPSRNNIVNHYRYMDVSKMSVGSRSFTATTAAPVRRPLSGDELKQLLSSITRVVSLHQLPIETPLLSATKEANATTALTNLAGVSTTSPPISSLDEYRYHKFGPLWSSTGEEAPANDERSPSPPIKTKKKKSRKFSKSSLSSSRKTKSVVGKTQLGGSASASGGSRKRRKSRPKYKSRKQPKSGGRAHSKDSLSSLEKDPVKNALFLRKYFEESIRLANKKSSDELLQEEEENEKPKSKKKKSKKRSLSKKSSTKTTTGKSRKST